VTSDVLASSSVGGVLGMRDFRATNTTATIAIRMTAVPPTAIPPMAPSDRGREAATDDKTVTIDVDVYH
jgi:hypothetical protein